MNASEDLLTATARIARVVQTTVGWIFWDPGAVARYVDLGLPEAFAGPLGYIAARSAPLAPAGPAAVEAAFGSISPVAISGLFSFVGGGAAMAPFAAARPLAGHATLLLFPPALSASNDSQ